MHLPTEPKPYQFLQSTLRGMAAKRRTPYDCIRSIPCLHMQHQYIHRACISASVYSVHCLYTRCLHKLRLRLVQKACAEGLCRGVQRRTLYTSCEACTCSTSYTICK